MALPPLILGIWLIATLLAKFGFNLGWITATAIGLAVGGVSAFFLGAKHSKIGVYMLVGGLALFFLAPHLGALTAGTTTGAVTGIKTATWTVNPSVVTNGVSLSGTTFTVPLTYNTTSKTVDKDPVVVSFTVTRTDTGTDDASFQVAVTPPAKITDPSTGLSYDPIEKDTLQHYKIYIGQGTEFQGLARVYPMKYGTSQESMNVTFDLSPTAFDYLNNYESVSAKVDVAGTDYTVIFQKVAEVS